MLSTPNTLAKIPFWQGDLRSPFLTDFAVRYPKDTFGDYTERQTCIKAFGGDREEMSTYLRTCPGIASTIFRHFRVTERANRPTQQRELLKSLGVDQRCSVHPHLASKSGAEITRKSVIVARVLGPGLRKADFLEPELVVVKLKWDNSDVPVSHLR